MSKHDEVLIQIRRIIRATDLRSKQLDKLTGLTAPQLLIMKAIDETGDITMSMIAQQVSLSQATVTNIVGRLEQKGLVSRQRSEVDRRKTFVVLTEKGVQMLDDAPAPLQEVFIKRFNALEDWEQHFILAGLSRVAAMMDATDLDASPLLDIDVVT